MVKNTGGKKEKGPKKFIAPGKGKPTTGKLSKLLYSVERLSIDEA